MAALYGSDTRFWLKIRRLYQSQVPLLGFCIRISLKRCPLFAVFYSVLMVNNLESISNLTQKAR